STTTNLCDFTHFISSALDSRLQVDAIYTDLTKAYDSVNQCLLLKKLKNMGLNDNLLTLIKSSLNGRMQYVEIRGIKSLSYNVNSGVSQGSNLGPLYFVIFFNDVAKELDCKCSIYADDLKLTQVIRSYNDCVNLQGNLDKFKLWCDRNK